MCRLKYAKIFNLINIKFMEFMQALPLLYGILIILTIPHNICVHNIIIIMFVINIIYGKNSIQQHLSNNFIVFCCIFFVPSLL